MVLGRRPQARIRRNPADDSRPLQLLPRRRESRRVHRSLHRRNVRPRRARLAPRTAPHPLHSRSHSAPGRRARNHPLRMSAAMSSTSAASAEPSLSLPSPRTIQPAPSPPSPTSMPHSAFISSGTWSLMGVELDAPIATPRARELHFTNEGGCGGSTLLLRNLTGLWLLQECASPVGDRGPRLHLGRPHRRRRRSPALPLAHLSRRQ